MRRTVHKTKSFAEAGAWDIERQIRMTPDERRAIAKQLKLRRWPPPHPPIRPAKPTS